MADVVMDYDAVNGMADMLGTTGDIVQVMDVVMTGLSVFLIATGFGSAIGAKYLGRYKQQVIELYQKCNELDGDLKAAVQAIQNGDAQGATKFY